MEVPHSLYLRNTIYHKPAINLMRVYDGDVREVPLLRLDITIKSNHHERLF